LCHVIQVGINKLKKYKNKYYGRKENVMNTELLHLLIQGSQPTNWQTQVR